MEFLKYSVISPLFKILFKFQHYLLLGKFQYMDVMHFTSLTVMMKISKESQKSNKNKKIIYEFTHSMFKYK